MGKVKWGKPSASELEQIRVGWLLAESRQRERKQQRECEAVWIREGMCRYCGPDRCIHGGTS